MGAGPVPSDARVQAGRYALKRLQFEAFLEPCEYLDERGNLQQVELAAFYDAVNRDIETASAALKVVDGETSATAVRKIAPLGAPYAIMAGPVQAELWRVSAKSGLPELVRPAAYDSLTKMLLEYRRELNPEAIRRGKQSCVQLSLWMQAPELYRYAATVTERSLVRKFHSAIEAHLGAVDPGLAGWGILRSCLILLGAMMLDDKQRIPQQGARSSAELLDRCRQRYPGLFERHEPRDERGVGTACVSDFLERVFAQLRSEITLQGVTFPMLRGLYEKAFLPASGRKAMGISATPLPLARKIMTAIPIEDVAPGERVVLDPCCGSGTLLFAALEHLLAAPEARVSGTDQTEYISSHLFGADRDPFSALLAEFGLLAFGLRDQRDIDVSADDTLREEYQPRRPPSVVLAHPPAQDVDAFVGRAVEWVRPGGYVAVILPFGFTTGRPYARTRERLVEGCELLELWDLPPDPELRLEGPKHICVARKRADTLSGVNVGARVVHVVGKAGAGRDFAQRGLSAVAAVVPRTVRSTCVPSALEAVWRRFEGRPTLGDVAEVVNGLKKGRGREEAFVEGPASSRRSVYRFVTSDSVNLLRVDWRHQAKQRHIDLSVEFDRGRREWFPRIVESPLAKVLVRATSPPHDPWRLTVALDEERLVPSNSLHFVLPRSRREWPADIICAVLTSRFANAWVYCHNKMAQVNCESLKMLPLPTVAGTRRNALRRMLRKAGACVRQKPCETRRVAEALSGLDDACSAAYRLTRKERKLLDGLFALAKREGPAGIALDARVAIAEKPLPNLEEVWTTFGEVVSVDVDRRLIKLWLADGPPGEEAITCEPPATFPGWALEPGACFEAEVLASWFSDASRAPHFLSVRPVGYGYLTDSEAMGLLKEPRS